MKIDSHSGQKQTKPGQEEKSVVKCKKQVYPVGPGKPDCIFYLRTGSCGFGAICRYNHPPDRTILLEKAEYPERKGEPPCQHYFKTGKCNSGVFCKYNHPKDAGGSLCNSTVNSDGYPLRLGEKECSYYLCTGKCKFEVACKFHHPQLERAGYPEREGAPECQHYLKTGECRFGEFCKYNHPKDAGGSLTPVNREGYPLRSDEKECSYYLSTGKCKFGLACKFHHPHPVDTTVTASAQPFHATVPALPPLSPKQYCSAIITYKVASPLMLPGSYIPGITMPASAPIFDPRVHSLPPLAQYTSTFGYSFARPLMFPGSYIPRHLHFIPGMVPVPDWNPYLGPNITAQLSVGVAASVYGMTQILYSPAPASTGLDAPYQVPSSAGPSGNTTKGQQCQKGCNPAILYAERTMHVCENVQDLSPNAKPKSQSRLISHRNARVSALQDHRQWIQIK